MARHVWLLILAGSIAAGGWAQGAKQDSDDVTPVVGLGAVDTHLAQAATAKVPESLAKLRRVTALLVVVDSHGTPVKATVVNHKPSPLDPAAIDAVLRSKFDAGNLNGKPVATECLVWVPFMGKGEPAVPLPGKLKPSKTLTVPTPVFTPEADYSKAARAMGISGVVLIRVIVNDKGRVTRAQLLRSIGYGLDEEALKAVSHYAFRPATFDGIPVPVLMSIEVNFRMK